MTRLNPTQPINHFAVAVGAITLMACLTAGAQTTPVPVKPVPAKKVAAHPASAKTATTTTSTSQTAPVAGTAVTPASSQTVLTPANALSTVTSSNCLERHVLGPGVERNVGSSGLERPVLHSGLDCRDRGERADIHEWRGHFGRYRGCARRFPRSGCGARCRKLSVARRLDSDGIRLLPQCHPSVLRF